MKFEGISVDDILANSKPEAVEQEAQIDAEKTGLDFSSVGVDSLIAGRDQQSLDATSAVTAKAPDLANRERMIAEKMETTRIDAEYNLEALEKQNESNEIGKVLSEAPTLTNHLANNPANAPILRNDLGTLRDIEKSFGKFGLEIDESGDIDLLADAETGWQAAREDVVENATVGFASGKAIGDQGILWAKIRDQNLEITEELKKVSESYEQKINGMNDRDSFIADAAQIVGTMTSAFLNSANETAALSGGVVAAGMATGIGAPVASTVAGAMVVGGSMRAMYDIEGGLAYKEMIEKGADPEKAKLISQGVGLVNSLIEFGGVTLLGKAFGPVMRTLTTKHTAKTAAALSEASMLNLISESSKAMVKSVGAEVATEVMQELVNVAGEGLANEFANAQFDENTLESVYDRLSEIAIKTAKGMFVLGSLGMAPTIVVGSRKVYEARKAEEFFAALSDGMSKSEAAQVAPEVMAGVVQQMAEDAKTGVVYVDAAELQQVLMDNNVSLDQLEELVPGVKEVLKQKAINKEDIVMPTGQYAAKIAGTDLGKALTPHVRLSENALSVSDAAKLRKEQTAMLKSILEGKVSEEDIDQDILQMTKVSQAEIDKLEAEYDQFKERMKGTKDEERKTLQAEAKAMRERIQTVKANMRVGFVAEYEALKTKMFEQIKETGVYNEADAKTNAKYGAWLVTNLARRAGLKPERVAELAPKIGTNIQGDFSQNTYSELYWKWNKAKESVSYLRGLRNDIQMYESTLNALEKRGVKSIAAISNALYDEFSLGYSESWNPIIRQVREDNEGKRVTFAMVVDAVNAHIDELKQKLEAQQKVVDEMGGEDYVEQLRKRLLEHQERGTFNQEIVKRYSSSEWRVLKRTLDNLTEAERVVFDEYVNSRSDAERVKSNLERLKDTPWAKQAVEAVFVRAAMFDLMNGQEPRVQSMLDNPQMEKQREKLKKGKDGLWQILSDNGFVGDASKPAHNVNSSFLNCDPSNDCAKFCYATQGNYNYAASVVKSEVVSVAIAMDPVRAAEMTATQYKGTFEFANGKALRLFDKGDGDETWLPYIKALNKLGVRVQIFSKRPDFLRQVSDFNLRLLSIDESNKKLADENPDLPIAFVYSVESQIPQILELHKQGRIQVVLPVKQGKNLLDVKKVNELIKGDKTVAKHICPIDAGWKSIKTKKNLEGWNCTMCDKNAGVGCFVGSTTKKVMDAAAKAEATINTMNIASLSDLAREIERTKKELDDAIRSLGQQDGNRAERPDAERGSVRLLGGDAGIADVSSRLDELLQTLFSRINARAERGGSQRIVGSLDEVSGLYEGGQSSLDQAKPGQEGGSRNVREVVGSGDSGKIVGRYADAERGTQEELGDLKQIIGPIGAVNISLSDKRQGLDNPFVLLSSYLKAIKMKGSPEEIRIATGWEKGADDIWRYEIDDPVLKETQSFEKVDILGKQYFSTKLGDLIEDEDLFNAYPDLRDVKVIIAKFDKDSTNGGYNDKHDTIVISQKFWDDETKTVLPESIFTLAHEIQHAIQKREGFDLGVDVDEVPAPSVALKKNIQGFYKLIEGSDVWKQYAKAEFVAANGLDDERQKKARIEVAKLKKESAEVRQILLARYKLLRALNIPQQDVILSGVTQEVTQDDSPLWSLLDKNVEHYKKLRYLRVRGEIEARSVVYRMKNPKEKAKLLATTAKFLSGKSISADEALGILGDVLKQVGEMERGTYSISSNSISLTQNADLSTFAHEMGHWYLETLFAIYGETTSASVRSDVEVMLKDFGLKSIDEWKALPFKEREVLHERFAFYVEQYLAEGKAPTKETRGFFKRFGAWIRGVYSRFGKGAKEELNNAYRQRFDIELPEMSEEVRRVLDRMLAAESAIKQSEQAEGIVPLFKQKPADMDDGLWEQLMQESDDAYAEATDAAFERMARDEKWYSNARSRKLKEIQQQVDEVKNIVRDKVEKELDAKAESKAFNMVKLGGLKMDPELLKKEGFDSVTIDALKKGGLCKRGGMSPTAVRELVRAAKSYHTTKRMIAEFVTLSDREKLVDELVTKRCLRDYSELFNTKKRDAIISKALHNEARGRMVATELSYLANDKEGRSRIYREAARRAAEQMINGMQIGSVSVRKFIAAEARASRKAYEALQNGDRYAAVLAKRAQLVQHEAALMAIEIEQEMRRVKTLKDRVFKADKKLAKTHDIDIINVARYVMTNEGLGKGAPSSGDPSEALKYVEKLKTYDSDKYALFTNFIDKHGYKGNIDFAQYTVSYAMEVIEDAQMLYRMAREAKTLTLDGKRLDREQVVAELVERFEMGNRGEFDGGKGRVISAEGKFTFDWMNLKSRMIRVEQWCHAMDGGQTGPFFNYIFKPIANAAAKYRNLNNKTQEALVTVLKPMVDKWSKVREIEAPEIGYTFATKAELIGAMLHTGNESNKAKLLLGGRGDNHPWARLVELQDGTNFVDTTQWDAFVARAMQRGIITKEDMDVIQQLWDLLESTKPLAQKAFKEMYGTYFEEVEATEVVTPWGNYRGGYVPAITEKYLVPATITNEEANRIIQQNYVSQMPVHQPGFSKSRVPNYTKPLALDVGLLCGHVQDVLKFAVMAPVSQEVAKVIADKRFNEPIEKHDPYLIHQMLKPWLNRAYEQTISDGKTDMVSSKLNQLRGIAGMNIMAGHVVNALQQWTGLSIAATKVNPRYMANALALVVSGKSSPSDVMELSPFMKSRLNNRAFEFQSQIEQIAKTSENVKQAKRLFGKAVALDEKLDAARDWVSRHGYFLQTAMQAPIDTIVWLGAYNQSIDNGMSEEDAVANADSIVRTTQSAFDPENVAEVETGGALYRCFLVFYNYFNMQLNLLGESWEGAKQTKKYGKFALDSMFIVAIPSILSAILGQMLTGFDTGEDDDWDAYDAMRLFIAEPLKNVIAMAPFLGGAITAGGTALANKDVAWAQFVWGEDPYQSRMMSSPAFDALATGGTGLLQWLDAIEGEEYNARSAVRGTLDLLSVITRLPLGALKKPLGYAAGVASGDIEPESTLEAVQGLLSGKDVSK